MWNKTYSKTQKWENLFGLGDVQTKYIMNFILYRRVGTGQTALRDSSTKGTRGY